MKLLKVSIIGFSVLSGVSLFFFNVNIDGMENIKGFTSYLMLFFTVAGIERVLNLIAKKIGLDCDDGK